MRQRLASPEQIETLYIGMHITTDFYHEKKQNEIVRYIAEIVPDTEFSSGLRIRLEEFICPLCGNPHGKPIYQWIDASWAIPVED